MIKGQDAGAAGEADLVHRFPLKGGAEPLLPAGAGRGRYRVFVRPISTPPPRWPARIGASPYPSPGYPRTPSGVATPPRLTPRQNDLLRQLAAGHTNTQIARRLGISEGTVRTHLENIYGKLGVSSRTAAVTRAFPDRVA